MKFLITLILSITSISAFSATSATLNLKGIILPILDISIEAETLATSLPLDQAVNNQKVGKVIEKSNSGSGHKVSVSSQNGGKLVRTGDSSSFINYQLSYNNGNIPLNTNPSQISTNSQKGQFERDLRISYSKPSDYSPSGEYSDIVTFTISAN